MTVVSPAEDECSTVLHFCKIYSSEAAMLLSYRASTLQRPRSETVASAQLPISSLAMHQKAFKHKQPNMAHMALCRTKM